MKNKLTKLRVLDCFCKAGGCSVGYMQAGFCHITGVDIEPQKNYPFEFFMGNAFDYIEKYGKLYDLIHCSPPCQAYSVTASTNKGAYKYQKLIEPVRNLLQYINKPYVIENVIGAPLINPVMLCGTMFGLKLFRHRLFEVNFPIKHIKHISHTEKTGKNGFVSMVGHGSSNAGRIGPDHRSVDAWKNASDIDWMTQAEMAQAIPPAYTKWIGEQFLYEQNNR